MAVETLRAVESVGVSAALPNWADRSGSTFTLSGSGLESYSSRYLLMQFAKPSAGNLFRQLTQCTLHIYAAMSRPGNISGEAMEFGCLWDPFDPKTVTYRTKPDSFNDSAWNPGPGGYTGFVSAVFGDAGDVLKSLRNGIAAQRLSVPEMSLSVATSRSGNYPYVEVSFGDIVQSSVSSTLPKASSRLNSAQTNKFSFKLRTTGECVGIVAAEQSVLHWQVSGSPTVKDIPFTGSEYDVPAGTLTDGTGEYWISSTLNSGQTVTSEKVSITVVSPKMSILHTYPLQGAELNKKAANVFDYTTQTVNDLNPSTLKITGGELRWRDSGGQKAIPFGAGIKEVTVPPDTFTQDSIDYCFHVNVSNGQVLDSPWVTLAVVEPGLQIVSTSPQSGSRINRAADNTFSCTTRAVNETEPGQVKVTAAEFKWRVKSQSAENTVTIPGGKTSTVIAANTFPSGELEYKFTVTPNLGAALESSWAAFSTVDTLSTAVALSPDGGIVNGDEPVKFTWQHRNSSGAPQTGAEIALSKDGAEYVNNRLPDSPNNFHTFPGGFIKSGKYLWKVRTYNLDGLAGSWSNPKQFIAVAAPAAPLIVSADNSPRPTVVWQSEGQSAYEIQIDGNPPETYYGTATSWKSPRYLNDGAHSFRIRIQGEWGDWSQWSETYLDTLNEPGPVIEMSGTGGNSAVLLWTPEDYDFYIVYRNGQPIAKTSAPNYTDAYSVGETVYRVRGCYAASNNYGLSNELTLDCSPREIIISGADGVWIPAGLSDNQYNTVNIYRSQQIESRYLAGREYPVSDVSPFRSKRMDLSFAQIDPALKAALQGLTGQLVCVKHPAGEMVRGYLKELSCTIGLFYDVYSVSVSQEYLPEVVKLD